MLFFFILFMGISMEAKANKWRAEDSPCQSNYSITANGSLEFCYSQRNNIVVELSITNIGEDTVNTLSLGWRVTDDINGTVGYASPVLPGNSCVLILPALSFTAEGVYSVTVWVNSYCNGSMNASDSTELSIVVHPPFEISTLSDTVVCPGETVSIAVPAGMDVYNWSNGASTRKIDISQPGNYSVTVTDYHGCQASDTMVLGEFQTTEALPLEDTVLCDGDIFTVGVGSGYVSMDWNTGQTVSSIDISHAGVYSVTVTDSNGCTYSDSVEVLYAQTPTTGTTSLVSICPGDTAIIGASHNFSSYQWNTGDTTQNMTINSSGLYIITVVGSNGCIGVDTVTVTAFPFPKVTFNDSVMCNMLPFVLDLGQLFDTMLWSTGDTTQDIVVSSPGVYAVTVVDGNGCRNVDSVEVINVDVSVTLGSDVVVCNGTALFLNPSGTYDSYLWSDGTTNEFISVSVSGIYSLTVTEKGCSAVDEVEVTIEDDPIADFSFIVDNLGVQFTNLSNQSNNLMWVFGDGDSSYMENPYHTYPNHGSFDVELFVSNTCGRVVKSLSVGVFPQGNRYIYINEDLKVFPTLAKNEIWFTLGGQNKEYIEYSVYDAVGKLVFRNSQKYLGASHVHRVDISSFASGTYYLRIVSDHTAVAVQPFMKK